jgi:hypothetical protein
VITLVKITVGEANKSRKPAKPGLSGRSNGLSTSVASIGLTFVAIGAQGVSRRFGRLRRPGLARL